MVTAPGTDTYETRARTLLDARMASIRSLVQAQAAVASAREALANAERGHADAYTTAERSGWTADELRKVGLDTPARRRPGRPRRATRTSTPDPGPAHDRQPDQH